MSPRCGFPDDVCQLRPRFLRLLSSCSYFPFLSQMMSPSCLPDVLSQRSPTCGLPSVSVSASCLPDVSQMWSPNCFPELSSTIPSCPPELVFQLSLSVFHLSPSCFPFVFQMLSPTCHVCLANVVSQLSPNCRPLVSHNAQLCPRCGSPIISQLLPLVSQLPPRCGPNLSQLRTVALNLNPSLLLGCKAGLFFCYEF